MNKSVILSIFLLASINVAAQDVVVKKDGSTILAKVLEVNQDNIKYKKFSNPNGPTYAIGLSDVMAVNYENGDKDNFNNIESNTQKQKEHAYGLIEKTADNSNITIIAQHNRTYQIKNDKEKQKSLAKYCLIFFGAKSSSIMSNEDIEMKFVRRIISTPYLLWSVCPKYCISIRNKTDRTVYIDKGNCFRLYNNGKYFIYYNNSEQTTVNDGKSNGVSVGLGSIAGVLGIGGTIGELANGINVGGSSSYSVSTTYSHNRIIAVPPHGIVNLAEEKWIKTKKGNLINNSEYKQIEAAETFEWIDSEIKLKRGLVNLGESLVYNELNSPWKRGYIITYSHDPKFSVYSTIRTELYLHQIIGCSKILYYNCDKFDSYIDGFDENTMVTCFLMDKE